MKKARYMIEGALCALLFLMFRILPLDMASGLGGFLGRTIGARLATSRKALRNLEGAMPELSEDERKAIIAQMWDNLGRVVAEYPHLKTIVTKRITVENPDIFESLKDGQYKNAIFIGGHLGNWEIWAAAALLVYGIKVDITYRAPNNPYVDRLIHHYRSIGGKITAYPKSREGGRKIMNAIKDGRNIAILYDQKYNEGQAVPFFGKPAMTNPIAFQLAQKYGLPLVPGQCIRTKGAHFILKMYPSLPTHDTSGAAIPLEIIMREANLMLEGWIRGNPGQWLWLHKRWDSAQLKETDA